MTVSTQVSRNEYTGNGATTQYDFTFRILDKSHLLVQTLDTSESIVTLTLGTDYTVTGVNRYNGGKVVLTSALPTGYKISIERSTPVTQEASIRNQGGFFPEIHEDAFDKLTMLVQQAYGWWSGLSLRKPSWLANYYDALNNRIRNLRDPSQSQDAATKNYVDRQVIDNTEAWEESDRILNQKIDSNFQRTLRLPDSAVSQLPSLDQLEGKILAFVNRKPIGILPESGTASDVLIELASSEGATLSGTQQGTTVQDEINDVQFLKQIPGFYYGSFFNIGSRNINIVVSKNGIDFSDTVIVRLPDGQTTYNSDPSIVFFKGRWYVAYTTTQAGVFDFGIGYSDDLFIWKNKFAQLNNGSAVCSNTIPWDDGTRPASMIWAPEFTVINNELYVIVSIYLGYDTTSGASSTLNRFGTGIARLIDPESFTFGELTRINYSDNSGDDNYYSRIDAIIKYDQKNNKYWQVVKRENYGILDTFVSNELHGTYQYLGTIDALQNVPGASTGYLNTSGIEAPTVYQLPDEETWSIAFDMYNTSDGIGYVTTKDFVTFSTPAKLTLDRLRHGTIQSSSETPLTPEAEYQLTSYIRSSSAVIHYNRPLSSQDTPNGMSIIPQSDTIYHAAVGGRTINLVRPVGKNYPKNFYFTLDLDGAQHKLTIAGDVFNGPIVIGNGITNNKLVRFEWDGFNGKYRCVDNLKTNSANLSFPSSTITTSFYPEYGRTYLTLTSITINGLPGNLPDGYWFNIILSSNQLTRMIKFAAGTDSNFLGTPAIWNYTGDKFDSVPITVRKCGDRWYVSHPPATVG